MWQRGFCIGGRGNNCPLRHYYNDSDSALQQSKRFQEAPKTSNNDDFSSPYRVKVVKEVEKQRMEEVDLDTGKRRSWIETKEYEIYDLTGETPVKHSKASPLKENSRNLVANLIKDMSKDDSPVLKTRRSISMPPPQSPVIVASNVCPVCNKTFKSERGVNQHRSRSITCGVTKENSPTPPSNDQSIIVIDTPPVPPPSHSIARRQSARAAKKK